MKPTNKQVLVVDDDYNCYYLIEELLSNYNVDVIYENSGPSAMQFCLKNNPIDLVLMDVKMKEMNGFETALHIKGINKSIPIVFQTAYAREFKKDEFMKNIGNGYIEKPFQKEQLINEVKLFIEIDLKRSKGIKKQNNTLVNFIGSIFHFL